jgi:transcription initiation factor TFIID subunit 7
MHWVRKRRFRKRLSYKDTANIEEEVQKLLEEDEKAERDGGETSFEILNRESIERSVEPEYFDEDADGEAVSTIEDTYDEEQEEMDAAAAEAELQGLFDMDNEMEPPVPTSETITASPANLADSAASLAQVQSGLDSVAATPAPAETSAPSSDEDESDEDEDDDEDIDVVDEDAAMKAAERAQQMEEINDLEREVEIQRQKLAGQKNQLLRDKTMKQLRSLEEDLRIKKGGLGMQDEDDDEE